MKIKRMLLLTLALTLLALPVVGAKKEGTTIQDGVLTYSTGHYLDDEPLQTGFDIFGYNYQGHMFKGLYANSYLGKDGFPPWEGDDELYAQRLVDEGFTTNPYSKWYWPYREVNLMMKWNDAWLSNKDCDEDGALDRYYGFDSYIGSGAWLTNHQSGSYVDEDIEYKWNYFVKIVAAPIDAYTDVGRWYTADDTEIGPVIWGSFAIIQQVENDPGLGLHGLQYLSPTSAGFGYYKP